MFNTKFFGHLTILLLSWHFMLVKGIQEPTDQLIDDPTEIKQVDAFALHKRPSFFVGSRYGRSGSSSPSGSSLFATSKTRRLNVVPRNDRFFLSSRYGKRAGMDFLQKNNKNHKQINDNSILAPLLSTPYEQALISEISTGTQLSSKPIPQQQQQHFNIDFNTNRMLTAQPASAPSSTSSSKAPSSSLPPYLYMSCVYTGLQNYYRCNNIDKMLHFKNYVLNDNEAENENDAFGAGLSSNGHDEDDDNDNDNDENDNDIDANDEK